jgi:hypothetical protein
LIHKHSLFISDSMAVLDTISKLDDYEDEDIFDVVIKLEKSFGLNFEKDAFYNIRTFGDLCDVFENYLKYDHLDDCTKQQTFYRVREAIGSAQGISRDRITVDSKLEELFPRHDRRRKAKLFKTYLALEIDILTYPGWLALTFGVGLLLSLVAFFFSWKIALGGLVFFIMAIKFADKLGNTLDLQTVRDLTDKLSREHYIDVRRTKGTINRDEVMQIIIDTFSNDLDIAKADLKKEARFSWTKNTVSARGTTSADDDQLTH